MSILVGEGAWISATDLWRCLSVNPAGPGDRPVKECYHNKFHPREPQCTEAPVYATAGLNDLCDGWTWCLKHAPSKDYRVVLPLEPPPAEPVQPDLEIGQ